MIRKGTNIDRYKSRLVQGLKVFWLSILFLYRVYFKILAIEVLDRVNLTTSPLTLLILTFYFMLGYNKIRLSKAKKSHAC